MQKFSIALVFFVGIITTNLCATAKTNYVIGGYIPGTPDTLKRKWVPVFQKYLTEQIGPLYNPPIAFTLMPVDYSPNYASPKLINAGILDFVCE